MDDGRWHHRIRQSWAKTFDICPERARLEHDAPEMRRESDAAAVGTAVHAAIEHGIASWYDHNAVDAEELVEVALRELDSIPYLPIKWQTKRGPEAFLRVCVEAWAREVPQTLPHKPPSLEVPFRFTLIDDDERLVEVSGTIDSAPNDPHDKLRDWKTSGRGAYEEWEYRRWAIQPTVYTCAWARLQPSGTATIPFEYVVLGRHGVQRFTVERGPEDWAWMRAKIDAMCLLIEQQTPVWPKQDNHALCSAKWCDYWSRCKGSHYAG